jgi:hypothetical protein
MSNLFTTAGTKLDIGSAVLSASGPGGDYVASDYSGQSFTEIGGTTNLGTVGDTAELVTSNQIGSNRTRKLKGTRNAGAMQVVCDLDPGDPGQIALIAAEKSRGRYAFRVTFNDAPDGGTPSYRYFRALVMSATEQYDEANSVMKLNATLELDTNIVKVNAAGAGTAPDNTALPTITGTAEVGETLTLSNGTWSGSPTPTYTYQWFAAGESIPGATASTFTLTEAQVGKTITGQVNAHNVNGTASAMSAATASVTS